ncbi:Major Facilitator Superfamily protein [Sphingobium faniae]|nr:Major Facilitator Superfamily protein [Sphingobium faniae]
MNASRPIAAPSSDRKKRVFGVGAVMTVLILVELLSSLEASMLYTALPTISRSYGGLTHAGWLISAFVLVQCATAAIAGRLGDLLGRRTMLAGVLLLCTLGSTLSALSSDLHWIIAGRAIQGMSGAILPLAFGIARSVVPQERLPYWIGLLAGAYSASGALGFLLGGVLTESVFGWHGIFTLTAILSALLIPPVLMILPADARRHHAGGIDWPGALAMAPAIGGLLLAITYGGQWGWTAPATLGTALGSLAVLILWARHEWRCPTPLIDVRLLADRSIAGANLVFLFLGLSSMQLPLVVMTMIQQPAWTGIGLGVGAALTGVYKLPSNIISLGAGPLGGWLFVRFGPRAAVLTGTTLCCVSWAALILWHDELIGVLALTVAVGAGMAITLSAVPNLVLAIVPHERSSEAAGLLQVTRTLGVAAGAQIAATILSLSQISSPAGKVYPSAHAFLLSFAIICAVAFCAVLCAFLLPRSGGTPASKNRAPQA